MPVPILARVSLVVGFSLFPARFAGRDDACDIFPHCVCNRYHDAVDLTHREHPPLFVAIGFGFERVAVEDERRVLKGDTVFRNIREILCLVPCEAPGHS